MEEKKNGFEAKRCKGRIYTLKSEHGERNENVKEIMGDSGKGRTRKAIEGERGKL